MSSADSTNSCCYAGQVGIFSDNVFHVLRFNFILIMSNSALRIWGMFIPNLGTKSFILNCLRYFEEKKGLKTAGIYSPAFQSGSNYYNTVRDFDEKTCQDKHKKTYFETMERFLLVLQNIFISFVRV